MTFTIRIKRWHAVGAWTWNAGDDVCGICRSHYDGCPPDGKYPGDDSPVVWGACHHAFHIQCIQRWLASSNEQRCPLCRRAWEYKSASEEGTADQDLSTPAGAGQADDEDDLEEEEEEEEEDEEASLSPEEGTPLSATTTPPSYRAPGMLRGAQEGAPRSGTAAATPAGEIVTMSEGTPDYM